MSLRASDIISDSRLPVRMQEGKYEWAGRRGNGDCSLRILKANLAYDDGMWECQVSQSSHWSILLILSSHWSGEPVLLPDQ